MATGTDITIYTTTAVKVPLTHQQCELLTEMCQTRASALAHERRKSGQSVLLRATAKSVEHDLWSLAALIDKAGDTIQPARYLLLTANKENIASW